MNENVREFFKSIALLRYVVMRNWEVLPPDGDIDIFVHPSDYADMMQAAQQFLTPEQYDIRTIGDGYYPLSIETMLLEDRDVYFPYDDIDTLVYVPNPRAHFMSLYYHGLIHKGDDRYAEKLKKVFKEAYPPVEPDDAGVGYHV